MGHLVNSTSTRIGWVDTWKDDIYLNYYHQCDYMHHFIRIRYFLAYVFYDAEPWDELIMIFSHFMLFKKRRTIGLIIFVYLGRIMLFSRVWMDYYKKGKKIRPLRYKLKRNKFKSSIINKWFMIWTLEIFTGAKSFDLLKQDNLQFSKKKQFWTPKKNKYFKYTSFDFNRALYKRKYLNWKFYNTSC